MRDLLPCLLLADLGEVLSAVVALLVPVLWVLKHIFEAAKQGQGQPPPRQAAAPPPPRPQMPAGGQQPAGQQADPLRSQVEEFLRRAGRVPNGGQAGRPQPRPRPVPASDIEVLLDDAATVPQRRPLAEPLRPAAKPAPQPRKQPASAAGKPRQPARTPKPRRETVAEHVAESVAAQARAIGEQTARLGQRIIEEDHQFDVQLKAKFDHSVGTLTGSAVAAAEQAAIAASAADTPAAHIAALLSNPAGVQQAIVINEIIRRPSDRW